MENQWYEPGAAGQGRYSPETAAPRRARPKAWVVVGLIILGLILLIALTSILFGVKGGAPEPAVFPDEPSGSEDFAEDFRDFFSQYYTEFSEPEECTIPRVASFPGLEVELREPRGTALALRYVYEKCAPSVVAITAYVDETDEDSYYWGSGVILTADGYIVTNAHVIEGTCRATVTLWNDEEYDVQLVGYDSRSDIAVLKIDARELVPAEFGNTEKLAVGDSVVAIGNPLGMQFRSTMTEGIISGIDRDISYNGTTMTLLQTSAPINEGNSGGPLFNLRGQVIGITNMKMSAGYYGSVSIEGVGFAIPSRTVKTMVDSILACGEVVGRPALGLTVGGIPTAAKTEYDLPDGLYVSAVSPGSDCEAKGILPGDIITAMNGESVTSTEEITSCIAGLSVGDTITFSLWRQTKDGRISTFDVTVALVDVNDVY